MAYVEAYVCPEYRDKIKNERFVQNFKVLSAIEKDWFVLEALRLNSNAFLLFLCTILFRISISSKPLFKRFCLRVEEHEKLRTLLQETLPLYKDFKVKIKISDWLRSILDKQDLFTGLHFVIATYESIKDETSSLVFANMEYRFPYNFVFNQVLVLFFFEKPRQNVKVLDYFRLTDFIELHEVLNGEGNNIKTVLVKEEKSFEMLSIVQKALVKQKGQSIKNAFIRSFIKENKRYPTDRDWIQFYNSNFPKE